MANPALLQNNFAQGMKRDFPRDTLPPGSAWNLVDYIPQTLGAPLRKRGGWSYASNDIAAVNAGASYAASVKYAEFSAGARLLVHDEDGELYKLTPGSLTVTDVGASLVPTQNPTFYRNLAIITDGTNPPKSYDGTTLQALGATAPSAFYSTSYHDFGVLARTTAAPNRVYFSDAGDPTTWDTTNSYIDANYAVTAVAPLQSALLIFSTGHIERIRGSIPPPDTDMVRETIFDVGAVDPWSVTVADDLCVFANPQGVYLTDGASLLDLTEKGGIKSYWNSEFESTQRLAAGRYRGHYIVAAMDGDTFRVCLVCHIESRRWWRFDNIKASSFTSAPGIAEELYFSLRSAPRIASFSSTFEPTASVKNDASGEAVDPYVELPFYLGGYGKKTWKGVYLTHDTRDAASDNPTQTISYVTSPEATSYTSLGSLSETTVMDRKRLAMRFSSSGVGFKVAQTNASADTRIYALEADVHGREQSRLR